MNELPDLVVVDSSAVLEVLGDQPDNGLLRRLRTSVAMAPELLDLEVLHVLRRTARSTPSVTDQATGQVRRLPDAPIVRVPHRPLVPRIWELRHSITAYDAAYIALAEQLDAPLVTCDAKLAGSNGHAARIELFPRN